MNTEKMLSEDLVNDAIIFPDPPQLKLKKILNKWGEDYIIPSRLRLLTFFLSTIIAYIDWRSEVFKIYLHPQKESVSTQLNTTSIDDRYNDLDDILRSQQSTIILSALTFLFFGMLVQNTTACSAFSRMIIQADSREEKKHSHADLATYSPLANETQPLKQDISDLILKWKKEQSVRKKIACVQFASLLTSSLLFGIFQNELFYTDSPEDDFFSWGKNTDDDTDTDAHHTSAGKLIKQITYAWTFTSTGLLIPQCFHQQSFARMISEMEVFKNDIDTYRGGPQL